MSCDNTSHIQMTVCSVFNNSSNKKKFAAAEYFIQETDVSEI